MTETEEVTEGFLFLNKSGWEWGEAIIFILNQAESENY